MFLMRGGRINQGQGQGWGCGLVMGDKIYIYHETSSSLTRHYPTARRSVESHGGTWSTATDDECVTSIEYARIL